MRTPLLLLVKFSIQISLRKEIEILMIEVFFSSDSLAIIDTSKGTKQKNKSKTQK